MNISMPRTYSIPEHVSGEPNNQIIWITDLHEDSCKPEDIQNFLENLSLHPAEKVMIGGDISNGQKSLEFLKNLSEKTNKTVYFVLGNHDYYGHEIDETRQEAKRISEENQNLQYLSLGDVIPLSETTALVGHGGWADGRVGDFLNSTISLNDYDLIEDLKHLQEEALLSKLQTLGDEAAEKLALSLEIALKEYAQVIVLTHVPPFKEVCRHNGMACDDNWGPHFVCEATGRTIISLAGRYLNKKILVLCGHSHTHAEADLAVNVRAIAGECILGSPSIQATINYL